MPKVLALAEACHPSMEAQAQEVMAAEAEARQAGALPNPELELEAEEFGGSGDRKGYDTATTTLRLSQTLETGGKRGKRREAALSDARLAGWDLAAARVAILAETKQAYVDVLVAQQRLELDEALLAVAGNILTAAVDRVRSGKVSPLEEAKAAIEEANARVSRDRSAAGLEAARKRLSYAWGGGGGFGKAVGRLDGDNDLPAFESLTAVMDRAPALGRWDEEQARAERVKDLAEADRVPDVTVAVGVARFEEEGDYAGTFEVSVPLPLFQRKAGAIAASRHRMARAQAERGAARLEALARLAETYNRLQAARAEVEAGRTRILPAARRALDAAQAGYQAGKTPQLEVLDAQRTYKEIQGRQLDAMAEFHTAAVELERLTGFPLNTID